MTSAVDWALKKPLIYHERAGVGSTYFLFIFLVFSRIFLAKQDGSSRTAAL